MYVCVCGYVRFEGIFGGAWFKPTPESVKYSHEGPKEKNFCTTCDREAPLPAKTKYGGK